MNQDSKSPYVKKEYLCKYGCGAYIKFDPNTVSKNKKIIPLNLDGTPHDCPISPYNKRVKENG